MFIYTFFVLYCTYPVLLITASIYLIVDTVSGITLEKFIDVMSSKMAVVDEDDEIRQTFLMFDSQCTYTITIPSFFGTETQRNVFIVKSCDRVKSDKLYSLCLV